MSVVIDDRPRSVSQKKRTSHVLHYASKTQPYRPALCGARAPRAGWWADALAEVEAVVDAWEVCPACQARYNDLPLGGGQ